MKRLHTALDFSTMALQAIFLVPLAWQAAVLAMIVVAWTVWKQRRSGSWSTLFDQATVFTHLFFFPAAIAIGVLFPTFAGHGRPPSPNPFATVSLYVLMFGSFVSCVFWVWKMKGFRWLAAGVVVLMELPILGALFVAEMSISGDWL